jgi:hypothetical protein
MVQEKWIVKGFGLVGSIQYPSAYCRSAQFTFPIVGCRRSPDPHLERNSCGATECSPARSGQNTANEALCISEHSSIFRVQQHQRREKKEGRNAVHFRHQGVDCEGIAPRFGEPWPPIKFNFGSALEVAGLARRWQPHQKGLASTRCLLALQQNAEGPAPTLNCKDKIQNVMVAFMLGSRAMPARL